MLLLRLEYDRMNNYYTSIELGSDTIKILVPLVVVVYNFEHIYHFAIWLIKKIPLSID